MADEVKYGILVQLRTMGQQALGGLEKRFKKLAKQTEAISRRARQALLGLVGALGAVTYAASEQEKADRKLADALKAAGDESEETYRQMKDLASEIQDTTTVGDEQTQTLIAMALNLGITKDKMGEAIRGAIGLQNALGLDMESALRYAALAMQGEFTVLQRYVPALRTAKTEAEKMAIVQELMAKGFEQAKGQADTLQGRLAQLKNRFGDLLQEIGQAILGTNSWKDTLAALEGKLRGAIEWVRNLTDDQKKHIQTMIKVTLGVLAVTAVLHPLAAALGVVTAAMAALHAKGLLVVALLASIAISVLVVTDALGVTNTGLLNLGESIKWVDWVWNELASEMIQWGEQIKLLLGDLVVGARQLAIGLLKLHKIQAAFVPGLGTIEDLLGFDPDEYIADLRRMNEETRKWQAGVIERSNKAYGSLWAGYRARHPKPGPKPGPGPKPAAEGAAAEAAGVAAEATELHDTLLPLLEQIVSDQALTKDEIAELNRRLRQLATATR